MFAPMMQLTRWWHAEHVLFEVEEQTLLKTARFCQKCMSNVDSEDSLKRVYLTCPAGWCASLHIKQHLVHSVIPIILTTSFELQEESGFRSFSSWPLFPIDTQSILWSFFTIETGQLESAHLEIHQRQSALQQVQEPAGQHHAFRVQSCVSAANQRSGGLWLH